MNILAVSVDFACFSSHPAPAVVVAALVPRLADPRRARAADAALRLRPPPPAGTRSPRGRV